MKVTDKKLRQALRYLKSDTYDDFWPDVLGYLDLLVESYWSNVYLGHHIPNPSTILNIPKPTLILRPGHFLHLKDRLYYQLLVNEFAKKCDQKLLGRDVVFSHRIRSAGSFFYDGIDSWKKFQAKSEGLFETHPDGFMLKTDITAYFEHISLNKLLDLLKTMDVDLSLIEELGSLLAHWTSNRMGIPQGHDPSSFLGNVYLKEVDEAMVAEGFNYYRFADDIRVFELEDKRLRKAISRLTELLRPLNLHLSGGKTKIIQKEVYFSEKNQFVEQMAAISYGLDTGEKIEVIEKKLRAVWNVVLKSKGFDKTTLKYCLHRFTKIKSRYALKAVLMRNLFDPSIAPSVLEYLALFIEEGSVQSALLAGFCNTPYEYERILILKTLLGAKKLKFNINAISRDEIYESGNFMLLGYYFIFVFKFGNAGLQSLVREKFNNTYKNDPRISRYFMIALNSRTSLRNEMKTLSKEQSVLAPTYHYLVSPKPKQD